MGPGVGRRHAARLFLAYALASLLPVLLLGVVLVRNTQHAGRARALAEGRSQAAVIVQMAIAPALTGRRLAAGLTPREIRRLHGATDLAVYAGSLTALRLRSFSGVVEFADDGSDADPLPASDPAFRAAAAGRTVVTVMAAPTGDPGRTIRVMQPVVPNATGEATGVLELYLPYAPIAAGVRREAHATYVRLAVGLALLYLVLAAISWSTTRRLRVYAARQAHEAAHDPLTALPNRAAFRAAAERLLADGESGALVLADLNRFKEVNDSFGHHAGDELLRAVAARLTTALRTDDVVARLGGDEFGLLLRDATDPDEIVTLLDSVHRELGRDLQLAGSTLHIEASLGVALFPRDGRDVSQLLIDADTAMYAGKRGVQRTVVYTPGLAVPQERWHEVQSELAHALEHDELTLLYQPQIDLVSGRTVAVEALARWQHPTRGWLPPSQFVPAAESSTLIEQFTRWALRRALLDLRQWRDHGRAWAVSVNVSARNLETPGFAAEVLDLVDELGVEPSDLMVELTETALANDSTAVLTNVTTLAAAGIGVSIDDFGTGATGLRQLRGLAVSEIKIDQAFVRELADNVGDQHLAQAIVQLAHGMNCRVVAEGVEDELAAAYLRTTGCDLAQGYLYRRPVAWQVLAEIPEPEAPPEPTPATTTSAPPASRADAVPNPSRSLSEVLT